MIVEAVEERVTTNTREIYANVALREWFDRGICREGLLSALRKYIPRGDVVRSAEDVLQIAAQKALKSIGDNPDYLKSASFSSWFYRVAINVALDERRKYLRLPPLESIDNFLSDNGQARFDLPNPGSSVEDEMIKIQSRRGVLQIMKTELNPDQFACIITRSAGYSNAEIAEIYSIPLSTVKTRIYDARQKLKKYLPEISNLLR